MTPNGRYLRDEGSILKREKLANTLERISMWPDDLYTGDLGRQFVLDVQNAGGLISVDDMKNYKVINRMPLSNKLGKLTHYTLPAPNGGPVLTHILNMNEGMTSILLLTFCKKATLRAWYTRVFHLTRCHLVALILLSLGINEECKVIFQSSHNAFNAKKTIF